MGYYTNLYTIEATASQEEIELKTSIYETIIDSKAYFSYVPGDRPKELHSYANGTIFCDTKLELLKGYPMVSHQPNENGCVIDANFTPKEDHYNILFHFVLPPRFIPRRDLRPLEQPSVPIVYLQNDRIIATYPVTGTARVRFCISPFEEHESMSDFQIKKLFHPEEERTLKIKLAINLGVIKIEFA